MTKLKSTYDTTTVIHIQILYFTPNQMQTFYTMMVKLYETSKSLTFVKHLGNQTSCVGKVLQGSATFTRCKVTRWKSMPVSCRKKNTNWMDDLTVNQLGGGKTRGRENQKTRNCFLMIVFEHVFFLHYCYPANFGWYVGFIQCFYHYVFFSTVFLTPIHLLELGIPSFNIIHQEQQVCTTRPLAGFGLSNGTNGRFTGDPSTASWNVVTKITNSSGPHRCVSESEFLGWMDLLQIGIQPCIFCNNMI